MTIKDLIEHLKKYDSKTLLGKEGYLGEFYEMDMDDFYYKKSQENPNQYIVNISLPYIGEIPYY